MSRFKEHDLQEFLVLIAWAMYVILRILLLSLARLSQTVLRALEGPDVVVAENTFSSSPSGRGC